MERGLAMWAFHSNGVNGIEEFAPLMYTGWTYGCILVIAAMKPILPVNPESLIKG